MNCYCRLAYAFGLLVAATALASPCQVVLLNPWPGFFNGICWDADYKGFLLVDLQRGEVLAYSPAGVLRRHMANPGSGPLEYSRPITITRQGDRYLLRDGLTHFIELGDDLRPLRSHDLASDLAEGEPEVSVSQFAPANDGLYAYGGVKKTGQPWAWAFYKVTWSPAVRVDVLRTLSGDEASTQPYILTGAAVASCGSRGYLLSFGNDSGLLEANPKEVRLRRGIPGGFGNLPRVPPSQGYANAAERTLALARNTGVAHVYCDGAALFIVLRDVRQGARRWLLARYDPEAQQTTGTWLLPSAAVDVLLAPGPKQWALLERDAPGPDNSLPPGKLVLFPSAALNGPAGTIDAPTPVCEP